MSRQQQKGSNTTVKDGNQARLENYLRAASPDPTNSPRVSEDDLSVQLIVKISSTYLEEVLIWILLQKKKR